MTVHVTFSPSKDCPTPYPLDPGKVEVVGEVGTLVIPTGESASINDRNCEGKITVTSWGMMLHQERQQIIRIYFVDKNGENMTLHGPVVTTVKTSLKLEPRFRVTAEFEFGTLLVEMPVE